MNWHQGIADTAALAAGVLTIGGLGCFINCTGAPSHGLKLSWPMRGVICWGLACVAGGIVGLVG